MECFDGRGPDTVPVFEVAIEELQHLLRSGGTQETFQNLDCGKVISDVAAGGQADAVIDDGFEYFSLPTTRLRIAVYNQRHATELHQKSR